MEKYGVQNVQEQQEQELRELKAKLQSLRGSHEKTAAETSEIARLESREAELTSALDEH